MKNTEETKDNNIFENMPVHQAYFKFSLPVVISMVISLIYNMADTYFIALTGNTALVAGVSLAAPLFSMMTAFSDIWGLGGCSLVSRLFGEKKYEEAKHVSAFCFWGAVIFGSVIAALLLVFRNPVLTILGAGEETLAYAKGYYLWIAAGAPILVFPLVPNNILRSEGLTRESMLGNIIGSIANIILDPIFIFGLSLGAPGAAMATVISNLIAAAYYVQIIIRKSRHLTVNPRYMTISLRQFAEILRIGIPSSLTNLMASFAVMLTNRALLPYGTGKIAALGIANKINMISILIMVGFGFGPQPLYGYNYGAGNQKRLQEVIRFCFLFETGLALAMTLVLSLSAPLLMRLFMQDAQIIADGALMLRMLQLGMVFQAIVLVITCLFQSIGKALGAFILSISRQGILFFIVLLLLSSALGYMGILISQTVSDILTALLAVILFRSVRRKDPLFCPANNRQQAKSRQ